MTPSVGRPTPGEAGPRPTSSRDLADALTIEELAAVTSGGDFWSTQAVERWGIPSLTVTDGPHGLRKQAADPSTITLAGAVPATCFPTAVTLASSWNPDLLEEVGQALGSETRAEGVAVILGPGVNIQRHPLGGRNFEYLSEDPLVAGILGAALARGIQSRGVGCSVKHLACNNQETGRTTTSSDVDERTLREIYLAPFERIVRDARPWTVMTANNPVNGVYSSQHRELITSILRGEWGFDGLVLSDWGSVYDRVAALESGLDLEMPANAASDAAVLEALRESAFEPVVRESARRLIDLVERTRTALADPQPADFDAHHDLARRAAAAGTVLLRNEGVLPLDPSKDSRIAVLGLLAERPRYQGAGSSQVTPTRLDAPLDELRRLVDENVDIAYEPAYSLGDDTPGDASVLAAAVEVARSADTVIAFVGLPDDEEAEGVDRARFALPEQQLALLRALTAERTDVIVVLANGSPVDMSWSAAAGAVVETWLGGQAGGGAIVDVLLGIREPGGRLAQTLPLRVSDSPAHVGWPGEEGHARYGEGVFVGYRYYDTLERDVAYPFGHGLTYTSFTRSARAEVRADGGITATLSVRNIGDRAGRDVVQAYARHGAASVRRPVHELVGFAGVAVEPGAEETVRIEIDPRDLAHWSLAAGDWVVPRGPMVLELGASSRDIWATVELDLPGNGVRGPLTKFHTLNEWLADDRGEPVVRAALGVAAGDPLPGPLADPNVLKLVGTTTLVKFAHFGMGIDESALHRMLEDVPA